MPSVRPRTPLRRFTALLGEASRRVTVESIRSPRRVLIFWAIFIFASVLCASRLTIETSISSLLDTSTASWSTYERSLDRHGSDEFVAIVLESDVPFDAHSLSRVVELTDSLSSVPGVERVDSLASVGLIRASEEGDLLLSPPLQSGIPTSTGARRHLSEALGRDPIAPGAYISVDQRAVAINVILDRNVIGDRDAVVSAIESFVGPHASISGVPIFRTRINDDTRTESFALLPFALALMAGLLFWAFRSALAVVLPLAVGGVGSVSVAGALGISGTPLSLSTLILPSVLLALGCAYAMHMIVAASGVTRRVELEARLGAVAIPVEISGLTTAVGFLSLSTATIGTIRELAIFGALGVFSVTAACISLLPALLASVELPARSANSWLEGPASRYFAYLCATKPLVITLTWACVALVSIAGLTSLKVSTDIISWYPLESKIRSDYSRIRDALSGISAVSLYVESLGDRVAIEPDVVHALDALSIALELRPEVGKALGINHPLRAMRAAYFGANAGLPKTLSEIQQYLLLLESEEPVWDVISHDLMSARLLMRVDDNGSASIIALSEWAENWWRMNGPEDFRAHATGVMYEFAKTNQTIVRAQLFGLGIALAFMGTILRLLLGGWGKAIVALVPNMIPLSAAYGAMGYAGIPLDAGTACLGSLALGIAVDDTVHVSVNWARERVGGADVRKAFGATLSAVLPALVISSACIVAGFAVLGSSNLGLVRNLGLVTSFVVIVCCAADVTLLPVLLGFFEKNSNGIKT